MPEKAKKPWSWPGLSGFTIFLVSLAKNLESLAWPGFARLAGLAVVKTVEMIYVSGIQQEFQLTYSVSETVIVQCVYSLI